MSMSRGNCGICVLALALALALVGAGQTGGTGSSLRLQKKLFAGNAI